MLDVPGQQCNDSFCFDQHFSNRIMTEEDPKNVLSPALEWFSVPKGGLNL
jgi:hypothetical protein